MPTIEPAPQPKKTFGRTLLYFLLGLAALAVLSSVLGRYLSDGGLDGGTETIAMVEVTGTIMDSKEIVRQLSNYRRDDDIKAIILRIDSPGGAVARPRNMTRGLLRSFSSSVRTRCSYSRSMTRS